MKAWPISFLTVALLASAVTIPAHADGSDRLRAVRKQSTQRHVTFRPDRAGDVIKSLPARRQQIRPYPVATNNRNPVRLDASPAGSRVRTTRSTATVVRPNARNVPLARTATTVRPGGRVIPQASKIGLGKVGKAGLILGGLLWAGSIAAGS